MKVYEALYNACVEESSYATLSIHKTRIGAAKAIREHKKKIHDEFKEFYKGVKKHGHWSDFQDWQINETKLLD